VLALGIELHVVLPFDTDEFERTSVVPAGPGWTARFRSCLTRASSITFGSDSAYLGDDELYGYAACIAMGHALNRARNLDATAVQLAVYDGSGAPGVAGTAHDVAVWAAAGHETQVIGLSTPAATASQAASTGRETIRAIGSILFTDFRGFSRLRDEHFPVFIENVYTEFGAILDGHKDAVLWRNAWGDATAVVFSTATAAADCALAFQETVARLDFAALGLPADLDLRIGGHAGPVLAIGDPISGRPTYWGRELTRAARIEPRTPGGAIYVTDAFAALLALQPDAPFVTEYVGRIMTAKDFERIPMYRLRRR